MLNLLISEHKTNHVVKELVYRDRVKPQIPEWGGRLPIALVFPEEESLALSTLGWQVVYRLLTEKNDFFVAERFFGTGKDGEVARSIDSGKPLSLFPLICFSLNFEGDYVNVLRLLKNSRIPLLAQKRSDWPLVMAGGPIAFLNPFPILPSLDFFYAGEAEESFVPLVLKIKKMWLAGESKEASLQKIADLPGVFVPKKSKKVKRQIAGFPSLMIGSQGIGPLQPAYSCFVHAKSRFRDMLLIEINRGCPYGCRFCAAGFIYRPPRQAGLEDVQKIVLEVKPRKVGLVGTALTDWEGLYPFLRFLNKQKIKFSLSSLRADGLNREFLEFLRRTGTRTLTLAVEGISKRLRKAINKRFDDEKFFQAVELISALQFNKLKLYFILGFPGENEADWQDLAGFLERLQSARIKGQGKRKKGVELVQISASCLVPKAWTPMQWAPMASEKELNDKLHRFKKMCSGFKGVRFSGEKAFQARIQGLLARGDEQVHSLLTLVADENGNWRKALKLWPGDMSWYLDRERDADEVFAWDKLEIGVSKDYLLREWQRYKKGLSTPKCSQNGCLKCQRCGMEAFESMPKPYSEGNFS
ncbi:radical SAM protein [Desulfohalobiaceae bacterium Ax17]|uniref:radical SAM protein n=1 Tax=Desulfovulcanus ferrireducens TaxID=2831190 RepID=UPI00207BB80A|nr:radical SAM protein [Desulfovulcanus ferrireducens]MBT8762727.1 radical SAM protein [Desulfovulcanus ferrireducens]